MYTITDKTIHSVKLISSGKMPDYWHVACAITVNIKYKNHQFVAALQTGGFYQNDYNLPANYIVADGANLLAELSLMYARELEDSKHTDYLNDQYVLEFTDSDYLAIYHELHDALFDAKNIVAEVEDRAWSDFANDDRYFVECDDRFDHLAFDDAEDMQVYLDNHSSARVISKSDYYANLDY